MTARAGGGGDPRVLRAVLGAAVVVVLLAVLVTGALWTLQRRLVYFPDAGPAAPAAAVLPGARGGELRTADGRAPGGRGAARRAGARASHGGWAGAGGLLPPAR